MTLSPTILSKERRLLFPTRLTLYQMRDFNELNATLTATICEATRTRPSVLRGEETGWQSGNDFLEWNEATSELGRLIANAVLDSLMDENPMTEIELHGWANVFTKGLHFSPHTHGNSAWSGVYYVNAGDAGAGGLLCLRDPRAGAGMVLSPSNTFDSASACRIAPCTGLLAIFPSWVEHWVTPYQGSTPRLSVSFNVR